jgi:hydrogenase maturation protease
MQSESLLLQLKEGTTSLKVLVLGIGNILMMDEGVGVRAIEEIQNRFSFEEDVELLDGGTSGIELLSYISGKDHLIVIDAIKSGHPPGTVLRVEGKDVPARFRTRISPHQLGLSDLLLAATLTGEMPKNLVLFGIEPKRIELGLRLSDEVKANFDKLISVVVEEIRGLGCSVKPKQYDNLKIKSIWE